MTLLNDDVREAVEYWEEKGKAVDVYFHNSPCPNLDEFSFAYRAAGSACKGFYGEGIFTHSCDPYFKKYGKHTYAVLVQKGSGAQREEEDGNMHIETFILKNRVLEITQLT